MSRHVPRVFCEEPLASGRRQRLDAGASHHLLHVLRLKPGAELLLFDGRGGEYRAQLVALSKGGAEADVGDHVAARRESPLQLALGQAISRGERMDYTIQKAVELGVSRIHPLHSERSLGGLDGARLEKKRHHWQEVARSAAEQSGRERVPEVSAPLPLGRWLAELSPGMLKILMEPDAARALNDLPTAREICLLCGPEGGLSPAEIAAAKESGFTGARLGPRILRTETAAVAALAVIQARWGDLCG